MNRNGLFIIIFFIILHLQGEIIFGQSKSPADDSLRYRENPHYWLQIGLYDVYKTRQANIVMLGNSLTNGVNWNELLGRQDVVERGIPSDVIKGFIARLDYVFKLKPKVVFVMGGINDIISKRNADETFADYTYLIDTIMSRNIKVIIQSTLYTSNKLENSAVINAEVEKLNYKLYLYAKQKGIRFINLNEKISPGKSLPEDFTYDGLHLNGKAYRIWGEAVVSELKSLNGKKGFVSGN